MLFPVAVLLQILGHVFRHQDVTSITTIHYSLRDVDAGTGNIGATTYVNHTANRPAMNPHAQLQLGVFACGGADLQGAFHRRGRRFVAVMARVPPAQMCRPAADTRLRMSYGVAGGCLYSFGARSASDFLGPWISAERILPAEQFEPSKAQHAWMTHSGRKALA